MRKLLPEQWRVGQVLARAVESGSGQLLAAQGTPLSERMIALFRQRGIAELSVFGGTDDGPQLLAQRLGGLEERFAEHAGLPAMAALKEMFVTGHERLSASPKEDDEHHGR